MKLILKIAAGIVIGWVVILVSGLIIATMTAKAISESTVKPAMDQVAQPFLDMQQQLATTEKQRLYSECLQRERERGQQPAGDNSMLNFLGRENCGAYLQ